jgi:hypothetical protein
MKNYALALAGAAAVASLAACTSASSTTVTSVPASTSARMAGISPATQCSPRTANGGCYVPGRPCSSAQKTKSGTDAAGVKITCAQVSKGTWHWVVAA